ncbi:MAG: hypothetical protein IPM38_05610 [Ignavibacteria bacterium]|nr:hypothetical protein [Ignavibacteria bacterium]
MRNKSYITFIINILIGIIFILPVYSVSGNQFDLSPESENPGFTVLHTDNTVLNKVNTPEITITKIYPALIPAQFSFSGKQLKINPDNYTYCNFVFTSNELQNLHFRNINTTHGSNIFLKNISSLKSLKTVRILC